MSPVRGAAPKNRRAAEHDPMIKNIARAVLRMDAAEPFLSPCCETMRETATPSPVTVME